MIDRYELAAHARAIVYLAIGAVPFVVLGWFAGPCVAVSALLASAAGACWWFATRWPSRWRPW